MVAIYLLLAVPAIVWGIYLALQSSLLNGLFTYLVLLCCFGEHFFELNIGIHLTLDRIFLGALVATSLIQYWLGKITFRPLHRFDWLLLAFVGFLGLSTFTHNWRVSNPNEVPIVAHLVNGYLIPLALYFIARNIDLRKESLTTFYYLLVGFGTYLAVVGLFEAFGLWTFVYPKYISDPEIGLHFGRSRGPMVHSVSFGIYLVICMSISWLLFCQKTKRWQYIFLALIPLFLATIYFTKTRSVWIGAGSSLFFLFWMTLEGRVKYLTLGTMVTLALAVGVTKMDSIIGLKREGTVQDTRKSTSMRASFTYVSWKMFKDRPVSGFGFGQFYREKKPYLTDQQSSLQLESIRSYVHHNTFLSLLTETGLIGLFLFLALVGSWTYSGWKLATRRNLSPWLKGQGLLLLATILTFTWQMLAHEITFTPIDNSLLYIVSGLVVGTFLRQRFETVTPEKVLYSTYSVHTFGADIQN
ncbi:MAG: O-antigen ligase family protein [Pirellulaceae bacterium]|nr:O-antigen ligase family protein [Pirellulaceae bacterium]